MSEQIREQVSAFLDGELPSSETELLLKRLTRDAELRESFGRYALIGEAMRGGTPSLMTRGFAARVNLAIDGEPVPVAGRATPQTRAPRWWRPFAGAAVAAGVAAVAVVALQQRAIAAAECRAAQVSAVTTAPSARVRLPGDRLAAGHRRTVDSSRTREAVSYTVPAASSGRSCGHAAGAVDQLCVRPQQVLLRLASAACWPTC